jgi:hypothetical protein
MPDSLPGIDLGKIGVVVLDGDRHGGPDGVAGLRKLFEEHRLDPTAIPMVITPQNEGQHAWFRRPEGAPLGNRDAAVRDSGVNVRGHGGLVIAPGARTPDAWFWPFRFAVGALGLIAGLPDKGKGLISADIIARCTKGGEWPCKEGTAPKGNVIWFTAEDSIENTIRPRLAAAGADLDKVEIVGMAANPDGSERMFNLATDLPLLKQKIEEVGNVGLVIIDPVSAY